MTRANQFFATAATGVALAAPTQAIAAEQPLSNEPGVAALQAGQLITERALISPFAAAEADRATTVKNCQNAFYNRVFTASANSGISYSVSTPRHAEVTVDPMDNLRSYIRDPQGGNSPTCADIGSTTRTTTFRLYQSGKKIGAVRVFGGDINEQEAPVTRVFSTKASMKVGRRISAKLVSDVESEGVKATGYNQLSSTKIR